MSPAMMTTNAAAGARGGAIASSSSSSLNAKKKNNALNNQSRRSVNNKGTTPVQCLSKTTDFSSNDNDSNAKSSSEMNNNITRRTAKKMKKLIVPKASSSSSAMTSPSARSANSDGFVWKGANLKAAAMSIGFGLFVCFVVPRPDGVVPQAWNLLSIFLATVAGLVLSPLPVGAWAFLGMTTAVVTKTLTFAQAFSAMTNDVIWLIVLAFFFARGFVSTGLGDRVATMFVERLGKSTLGLSYGLSISEAVLAPAMPSTTARAGGVYLPIITSLAKSNGSEPGPTANKMGSFLMQTQLQCSGHSSALCMTAAAQNLLSLKLAAGLGIVIANPWITWFKAACVPGILGLILTPLLVYKLFPPEIQDTPDAPAMAKEKLKKLGPLSQDELAVVITMSITVFCWIFQPFGITPVISAMFGMSMQLFAGVIKWADCLNEKGAWDTLVWFAVLIGMSAQLNELGFIQFIATKVSAALTAANLAWPQVFLVLHASYFAIHYFFASQTAQVAALSTAFLAMMLASGVPPMLAGLTMAFHTNLFGAITHYASGQSAVYFGSGYVELKDYFRLGAIVGAFNFILWAIVGGTWWKVIGLY
jgi:DASS family divalent anion:Na+ symporter